MTTFRFNDPDQYVNGTPFQEFARLRKKSPFAWHEASDRVGDGFWLATKHADIVSISRNPRVFASNAPLLVDPLPKELWPAFPALAMIANNFVTFNAHKHALFRSIGNSLFSAVRIAEIEDKVRAVCAQVMESVSRRPRFDFASEVALAIPVEAVLGIFLGVPHEDLALVSRCVLTINAMDDPVYRPRREAFQDAAEELFAYGMGLLRRVKAFPAEDLFSKLVHDKSVDGVSVEELFLAYWFPLAAAAFDTTASTIAGGVQALLEFPEQLSRLRENPDIIPLVIDEMLRWVSPVVYFRRTATSDTEFNGNHIGSGQKVILCYASANRDEEVFVNPDCFDVTRYPNPHLSFGYGPHFCLGARLASMILHTFLEEFLLRMPCLRLDGELTRTRSGWMNRIRSMPVTNAPGPAISLIQGGCFLPVELKE